MSALMKKFLFPALLLVLLPLLAWAQTPSLTQIMADPDWIGPPVDAVWWQLDGSTMYYQLHRGAHRLEELHSIRLADGADEIIDPARRHQVDGRHAIFHESTEQAAFIRDGNLFLRTNGAQTPQQVTRGGQAVSQPTFSPDGQRLIYLRGSQWWIHELASGLEWPAADLRFEADPDESPEDELAAMQLRLFDSLSQPRERARELREQRRQAARLDPSRGPAPWYLGKKHQPQFSSLSPDGRWLLLAMQAASADQGPGARMPHYVTESGRIDVEDVRTRVGRNRPSGQQLWLLDLQEQQRHELDLAALPGIKDDPLAELKAAQGLEPLGKDQLREVAVMGLQWHSDGTLAAVQLRAVDNKDRWLAVIDTARSEPQLQPRHRLSDPAWINWSFNAFGWLPGSERLWLLSEESGYSHFYTLDARRGKPTRHTHGEFEIHQPWVSPDGKHVLLLSNRSHPGEFDLYRLQLKGNKLERITEQRGIESFAVSPTDSNQVLVRYSAAYLPPQAGLVNVSKRELQPLTDTRSAEFAAIEWQMPQIVAVPSSQVEAPIWSKFYPAQAAPPHGGERHPIVLFVHGAGYLQNTWLRYPNYFREQMFHNLLTERGYHVLDMDFRASAGYGRDWRTAIYRHMGEPELRDLIDGVDWLVEEHQGDPERVGVYGGSYGGFMALMALFKAPEVFDAGAALRPVTDWNHYNHPYTANILNTPQLDPEAFARSSPLEFAEGLEGHLLIAHGMLDDNVFYQDSVRLAQRLIELHKNHWELASYPMESHGFVRADSWRDEYWRILNLFEQTIARPNHP